MTVEELIEEGYDESQAWEIALACPCSGPKAKSPYQRYKKQPYDYKFPRCAHSHTHAETFAVGEGRDRRGVRVKACNVCNTIQGKPEFPHHLHRVGEYRKAA